MQPATTGIYFCGCGSNAGPPSRPMSGAAKQALRCWVYRSSRKDEMYLYLSREDGFDSLPAPLQQQFGRPSLVMQLELHSQRRLAREDAARVMQNLRQHGYHLQLPPQLRPELFHGD